jgi:hypothetical protein
MDGDAPYTIHYFEEKRKKQQERADKGEPSPVGLIEYNEAELVAAYATFYVAEDFLKSSETLERLTYVLVILTAILAVSTVLLLATR